jgi:muramidase (phage lysozyme)
MAIPRAAKLILDFIAIPESGGNYNAYFAHGKSTKDLSKMTLDEIEAWSKNRGTKSSATGRYQFMRDTLDAPGTLKDIEGEMGLTGKELFTPELQDRMGYHLLKRRGYEKFINGKISISQFGLNLAKEWASFPVLSRVKGAHRTVTRGQTFYSGDKLNKALVKPEAVEALLARALAIGKGEVSEPTEGPESQSGAILVDRKTLPKFEVCAIQRRLRDLGYYMVGKVDGIWGPNTDAAISALRTVAGLPPGGWDEEVKAALADDKNVKPIAPERANTTVSDIRAQGSETIKEADKVTTTAAPIATVGLGGAVVTIISDWFGVAKGMVDPLKEFFTKVPSEVWFIIIFAIAAHLWYAGRNVKIARRDAERSGLHAGEPEPAPKVEGEMS